MRIAMLIAAAALLPVTARADLLLSGAPSNTAAPIVTAATPSPPQPSPPRPTEADANPTQAEPSPPEAPRRRPAPLFKTAYGFGDQVPLAFAIRQIVPKAVSVSYGPGATGSMLVTWKGDGPWNRVLIEAVEPLGLRVLTSASSVEIRK